MFRYDIQTGNEDPYEDCVASMRLYKRMISQVHKKGDHPQNQNNFALWRQSELEKMTPDQLLEISRSDFYCWCLDSQGYCLKGVAYLIKCARQLQTSYPINVLLV